jgi:hypothetical protein
VISSVTGCSTCSRVFISMNQMRSARRPFDASAINSIVPAPSPPPWPRAPPRYHLARCIVHARRRRFLDHLLVAALRAIALEQVDHIAMGRRTPALDVPRRGYFSIRTRSSPNELAASRLRLSGAS